MKITVTVAGPTASGKSLVSHHLAKTLRELGLNKVTFVEKELDKLGVRRRLEDPQLYVEAINSLGVEIEIVEVQLKRGLVQS